MYLYMALFEIQKHLMLHIENPVLLNFILIVFVSFLFVILLVFLKLLNFLISDFIKQFYFPQSGFFLC